MGDAYNCAVFSDDGASDCIVSDSEDAGCALREDSVEFASAMEDDEDVDGGKTTTTTSAGISGTCLMACGC